MNFLDFAYIVMTIAGGMIFIISVINLLFSSLIGPINSFIIVDFIVLLVGFLLFIFGCSHFISLRFI